MSHSQRQREHLSSDDRIQHLPRKRFGQHFLTDRNILRRIARAAELQPGDRVLEIGPGLGHLTRALAETGAQVVAVEVDRDLAEHLRAEFRGSSNVHVLEGDILAQPPAEWLARAGLAPPYVVVANLPYYITSAIIRYLLEAQVPPTRLVIMVQREVAQQIVAKPPRMSLLAVSVQFYGTPRILDVVPAGSFSPRPRVDSAVVRIDIAPRRALVDTDRFFRLVRAGFGARRKQLRNSLANGLNLHTAEAESLLTRARIESARRAETLTLEEWGDLYRVWSECASASWQRE